MIYLHMYGILTYPDKSKFPVSKIILANTLESQKTLYSNKVVSVFSEYIECALYFKSFDYESPGSEIVDHLYVKRKTKEIRIINA